MTVFLRKWLRDIRGREEFRQQIVRSALNLGRKYDFDEAHACHVAELSTKLFHELQDEHKLSPTARSFSACRRVTS